jgi:uncharacterized membrane protein YoaK (UPF0700 family)
MLSARAYSFKQKSKLAVSLSWIGGYANAVVFLAWSGAFISNMSGNSTRFGSSLADGPRGQAVQFGLLIGLFWFGAVVSAFMTESAQRRGARSKYILPMATEGMLLSVLCIFVAREWAAPIHDSLVLNAMGGLGAFTMGLQNATITEISGAVIRTTHVTGVITDFGLEGVRFFNWYMDRTRGRRWARAGRALRISQRHPSAQRLGLLFGVFWSFVLGAAAGTWMYRHHAPGALLVPVGFLLGIILLDWWKPIAGVKELDPLSDPELKAAGIVKALLPAELGLFRLTHHRTDRAHRPPDLVAWIELLPPHWRVIILAVSPRTHFDANSVLALCEVIKKLRSDRRELIICGMTAPQYKVFIRGGLTDVAEPENLCPDLEFAIARGIEVLRHLGGAEERFSPAA